jgi:23S rRNA (pseudouridine1915-N3)-methyltransferase
MILILAVGQRQPAWVKDATADYLNRFPADRRPIIKETKAEPRTTGKTVAAMLLAESERLRAIVPCDTFQVALDERGMDFNTEELSVLIQKALQSHKHLAFMIGGPDGLDVELKASCHANVRLSSLTLPHGLVRVVLAEQIYRAFSIQKNHPYHRF